MYMHMQFNRNYTKLVLKCSIRLYLEINSAADFKIGFSNNLYLFHLQSIIL
jgi:hypothetical protein